jgi:hypothetical protein
MTVLFHIPSCCRRHDVIILILSMSMQACFLKIVSVLRNWLRKVSFTVEWHRRAEANQSLQIFSWPPMRFRNVTFSMGLSTLTTNIPNSCGLQIHLFSHTFCDHSLLLPRGSRSPSWPWPMLGGYVA